jgi:hypothetical protein
MNGNAYLGFENMYEPAAQLDRNGFVDANPTELAEMGNIEGNGHCTRPKEEGPSPIPAPPSLSLQTPPLITLSNCAYGRKAHFRQVEIMKHIRIAFAIFWRDHCNAVNHFPPDAISATFQSTESFSLE